VNTLDHCFLYGIVDLGYVQPETAPDVTQKLVRGGIDLLQLRAKDKPLDSILRLAENIFPNISRTPGRGVTPSNVESTRKILTLIFSRHPGPSISIMHLAGGAYASTHMFTPDILFLPIMIR